MQRRRDCEKIPGEQRVCVNGRHFIHPGAILESKRVTALMASRGAITDRPEAAALSSSQLDEFWNGLDDFGRFRFATTRRLLHLFEERKTHFRGPGLIVFREEALRILGESLARARLKLPESVDALRKRLIEWRRRADPKSRHFDFNRDGRGKWGRDPAIAEPELDVFVSRYSRPSRPSLALARRETAGALGLNDAPSTATFKRAMETRRNADAIVCAREGPRAFENNFQVRGERDWSAVRANEVWFSDESTLDFVASHEGKLKRLKLLTWLCAASRYVVAWAIAPTIDSGLAARTFAEAVRAHGAPKKIIIDNGKIYTAKSFAGGRAAPDERLLSVCGRIGVGVQYAQPYTPTDKSIQERFFGTVHAQFCKSFSTYCGATPSQKPEDLLKRIQRGELSPPTREDVAAQFTEWLETYHQTPHSSLEITQNRLARKLTPAEAFISLNPIPRRTASDEELAILLSREATVRVPKKRSSMIRFEGVRYRDEAGALRPYAGKTIRVRICENDAGALHSLDEAGNVICRLEAIQLKGLSREDLREFSRKQRVKSRELRKLARAYAEPPLSIEEMGAIEMQRRHAEAAAGQRRAAGGEIVAPPRNLSPLPGAGRISRALRALKAQEKRAAKYEGTIGAEMLAAADEPIEFKKNPLDEFDVMDVLADPDDFGEGAPEAPTTSWDALLRDAPEGAA